MELICRRQGRCVGTAHLVENEMWLEADCLLPGERGLCKLWLLRGERRLLLGTPQPGPKGLTLHRRLSLALLRREGVYPPEQVEVAPPWEKEEEPSWRAVTRTAPAWQDSALEALFCTGGWEWQPRAQGVALRTLWRENTPFPAMPFFSHATLSRRGDAWQVLLCLDDQGRPT